MPYKHLAEQLKQELSAELYAHSEGVAETAAMLAASLGVSKDKARLAGWFHDCAREWTSAELIHYCGEYGIEIDLFAQLSPVILHGPVGAVIAQKRGVNDGEVLSAIRNHTLGCPEMTVLEQILYVADKIEPNRCYPGVEKLREAVRKDFQQGLLQAAAQAIAFVLEKRQVVHPQSISFWNWLVEQSAKGV